MDDIKKTGLSININARHPVIGKKGAEPKMTVPHETAKYGNKKTGGFDSKKEYDYFNNLKLKEKAGLVTGIQCQVTFQLSVCKYVADFVFFNRVTGAWDVVDVKSIATRKLSTYRLKNKMMLNELNIKIIEV